VGVIRILAGILFIISVPVALVTSNIRFMANEERVYRYAIDEFNAVAKTGIEREELLLASAEIRDYFNNDEETLVIRVQQNGREVDLFNDRETAHMEDVKARFQAVNRAQEFSVIYALSYIAVVVLWAREVSLRTLAKQLAVGSGICVVAIAGIGVLGAAGFDSAWEDFHRLIFSNDFWLLNPATDRLIQIFPLAFWENIVFVTGLLIGAQAGLILLASLIYIVASRRRASRLTKESPQAALTGSAPPQPSLDQKSGVVQD
jgi:integral membrane protein (TIGR01906 family)